MKKHAKKIIVLLLAVAMLVPTIAMLYSSAASYVYPVELGFNNLFIFEDWSRNKNSTTVVGGTTQNVGTLTTDVASGSFTLAKTDSASAEVYTGHGMDKENAISNMDYYKMSVEPNTTYCLSYTLGGTVTAANFFTTVFMFDSNNLCKVWTGDTANNTGSNKFIFTTPAGVTLIQIRFGISGANTTSNAQVSNISLSECDVVADSTNLFNFDSWAGTSSGTTIGVSNAVYADGTFTPNTTDDSIQMNLKAGGSLFTGFSLETTSGYYTIPVSANTNYVLSYTLVNSLATDFKQFTPYIVTKSTSGAIAYVEGCGATGYGQGSCVFTTGADTAYISPVFTVGGSDTDWVVTVKDIKLMAAEIDDNTMSPHRLLKTYGEDETYGTLPTPSSIPDGYIFTGWNTREDGLGMRITANTAVQPKSLTVYPKFERAVDSLTVKTQPSKTVYTVGEKLDTTGLVLTATVSGTSGTSTLDIASGYYCTPEVLSTAGTQTITANYGGKTATFTVTVKANDPGTVVVNGVSTEVPIANNEYTFNLSTSAFNRYEVTYKSDSYVSGVATFNDGITEEFFLEPSESGHFASYINDFLTGSTYNQVVKIKFTTLDKEFGEFELISLNTVAATDLSKSIYMSNHKFEMGIALDSGGVVSELYDVSGNVYARTYSTTHNYQDGNGNVTVNRTQVDYKDKLDENYGSGYSGQSTKVNLINTYDQGRFLQQSYYGSGEYPYVQSTYNNAAWPYNPVQGGNVIGEASKIIDYKVTDEYIYIKARPLDWAKWSDDYIDPEGRPIYDEIEWGDDYITDTYVEAWYYFQGDTIKVTNRKVDYSGLADNVHSQEFPALYLIEPLNHFVYNNVSKDKAWTAASGTLTQQNIPYSLDIWKAEHEENKLVNMEEPEYWGLTQMYIDGKNYDGFEPWATCNENWAAFTASDDPNSFGVGLYTDVSTKFYYGVQPAIYQQSAGDVEGSVGSVLNTLEYRHSKTTNPAPELPTAYIAPTDTMTFRSFEPTEFTYYLATGTSDDIREDFRIIAEDRASAEAARPKIAVPETVYMKPADGNSKIGQYYVNNIMNPNNYYSLETEAERDSGMYLGLHIEGASKFSVEITNVTEPSNDIYVGNADGSGNYESTDTSTQKFDLTDGTVEFTDFLGLHFSVDGLEPGEKATAKWEITTYDASGNKLKTYTAYTVMYAPGRTVGAVAEARRNGNANNELSSWITGANGVDHSQRSPLGSFKGDYHDSGRFIYDPLVYTTVQTPAGAGSQSEDDYIITTDSSGTTDDYGDNAYVLQTAPSGEDDTRSQSYLGLLAIDKSRYTNTDQIPNLKIGWDALRVASYQEDSFKTYNTYYTLGTIDAFVSTEESETPIGWTTHETFSELKNSHSIPYRSTLIPSYTVSDDIDGKYIHAIAYGRANNLGGNSYSTAGTSVLISVTDKSELRDSVTKGYGVIDGSTEFNEALKEAATVLGDPSASQEEIDRANDALSELLNVFYALKYDNFFSAYEFSRHSDSMTMSQANESTISYKDGTLTTTNTTLGTNTDGSAIGETYSRYGSGSGFYTIDLSPNTEYVFEYDVTTTAKSQVFMFFYNSSGSNSEAPTNISVKVNNGDWSSKTESNSWWGNYQNSAGNAHYVIKFTTGATTTQASFRFGNTVHDACTSTFSNIRLIDSARYYEDVTYTATEAVYKEYAAYGALQVPVRPGYTFNGWIDKNGTSITAIDTATEHESIFSTWEINTYTITYNANGGTVSPASQSYKITYTVTLPTPTRDGYTFQGWKVTSAEGSWAEGGLCPAGEIPTKMYGNVTLEAQWSLGEIFAYFDTILDFSEWNTETASNATFSNVTENGFTLTSNAGVGEGTSESPEFPVTAGKQYYIDIDFTGNNWDVYIFFRSNTVGGTGINFQDGTNRFSSSGAGNQTRIFTAPAGATKAVIRVDANNGSNAVTFSDIRVYEATTCAPDVNVPYSTKELQYGSPFGTLPVPTREGYTFLGWYDGDTLITADSTVTQTSNVYLKSKWKLADSSLGADAAVADFGAPISIDIDDNDTIFAKAATSYGATSSILGLSTDGGTTYSSSVNGSYGTFTLKNDGTVTYAPNGIINGIDTVYYHAQLSKGDTTVFKNTISVVPASNVLYEETVLGIKGTSTYAWASVGSASADNQDVSTENDCYGYDTTYNEISEYSNGSARKVTVNSTNKRSDTLIFNFNGTGFDLMGSCGPTTGVQIVTVRNSSNQIARVFMVDTYYSDSSFLSSGGNLNQIPIVCFSDAYDTYSVEVTAAYLTSAKALKASVVESYAIDGTDIEASSTVLTNDEIVAEMLAEIGMEELSNEEIELIWMDDNSVLNGGTGAESSDSEVSMYATTTTTLDNYVDSIRVYNPIKAKDQSAYNAKEYGAVYYNVVNNLADAENGILSATGGIFAYLEGSIFNGSSFSDYATNGPKNELYLSNYMVNDELKGVTFNVTLPEGARVMLGARAASGEPMLKINGTAFAIGSSTEMYYDITQYLTAVDGVATVTLANSGTGLLAINNMKLVGAAVAPVSTYSLERSVALMSLEPEIVEYSIPVISQPEPDDTLPETDDTVEEDNGTENEETPSCFEQFIEKVRTFFSDIFGYIKWFFEFVISIFTTKEVF